MGSFPIGKETSVAFRSAKERRFRGAKGDHATVIDVPVLTRRTQSAGGATGQSLRMAFNSSCPGRRAPRLPQHPGLGTLDHARRQRVPLHVTTNAEQLLVLLHGETLETPLIYLAPTDRVVRHVLTHRVGVRQPDLSGSFDR